MATSSNDDYFRFDVPVYRLDEATYYAARDAHVRGGIREGEAVGFYQRHPERKFQDEERLRFTYGGAWRFNEIIAWIRVGFDGGDIIGEAWKVRAKRIVHTRRKLFECSLNNAGPPLPVPPDATNDEVFQLVLDYVDRVQRTCPKRFVDTTQLRIIGAHLDWNEIRRRYAYGIARRSPTPPPTEVLTDQERERAEGALGRLNVGATGVVEGIGELDVEEVALILRYL
jgi:hypothetical protein